VGTRKEIQEDKEVTTKFNVKNVSRENDFGLWKLKSVDRGCGKGPKVVGELKSFNSDTQQGSKDNTNITFELGNSVIRH